MSVSWILVNVCGCTIRSEIRESLGQLVDAIFLLKVNCKKKKKFLEFLFYTIDLW